MIKGIVDKYGIGAALLGLGVVLGLIALLILAEGWAVKTLWNAVIVPQGAHPMGTEEGIGLLFLTHILFASTKISKSKKEGK